MATLKEILEAKKQVVEVKKEETVMEPAAEVKEAPIESPKEEAPIAAAEPAIEAIASVPSAEEIAASLGLSSVPQFRVFNFAYAFKTGSKVLKPDSMGVYHPENSADFDYLAWQVKQGRILFN